MRTRPSADRERATIARRLRRNLHELAEADAKSTRPVERVLRDLVIGPAFAAAGHALLTWIRGASPTSTQMAALSMVAVGFPAWRWWTRRRARRLAPPPVP